jgi:hypothetical protein
MSDIKESTARLVSLTTKGVESKIRHHSRQELLIPDGSPLQQSEIMMNEIDDRLFHMSFLLAKHG